MITSARHIHVVVLIAVCVIHVGRTKLLLYKVRDSNEEGTASATGFSFPDFFGDVAPFESRSGVADGFASPSRRPITTLYDDWTPPGDEGRQVGSWRQQHVDDGGSYEEPSPHYHRGDRPYSHSSLKQHYKPIGGNQVRPSQGVDYQLRSTDAKAHSHNYDVSHEYVPRKKPNDYDIDNLHSTKPQQFSNGDYAGQNEQGRHAPSHDFRPSPPDPFLSPTGGFDVFSPESSNPVAKTAKPDVEQAHLDKSCVRKNKTASIDVAGETLTMRCYDCYDKKLHRHYEQCVEKTSRKGRFKRALNGSAIDEPISPRGKRQQNDYYDGSEDASYGPDSKDYRFGPEHFTDDYSESYDDSGDEYPENDGEKCHKSKKGEMTCISCENLATGGTYQQCSYASDPKRNSYERSVSKSYGSPRLTEEVRRKRVEYGPTKGSNPERNFETPRYKKRPPPASGLGPKKGSRSPQRLKYSPKSRAYSHSSDPSSVSDVPDPYSPDPISLIDDSILTPGTRPRKNVDPSFVPGYDESFSGLFPELADGDPIALAPPSYDDEYSDYDYGPERRHSSGDKPKHSSTSGLLPSVGKRSLQPEYGTKNKTLCKKVKKNKMLCSQCVDHNGSKTEECTYSVGSDPKSNRRQEQMSRLSRPSDPSQKIPSRGKRKFKKFDSQEAEGYLSDNQRRSNQFPNAPRRQNDTSAPNEASQKRIELRQKREDTRKYNAIPTDPSRLSTEDAGPIEDVEHSADVKSVYDPVLGLSLPTYMLDRSEYEVDFDQTLASG